MSFDPDLEEFISLQKENHALAAELSQEPFNWSWLDYEFAAQLGPLTTSGSSPMDSGHDPRPRGPKGRPSRARAVGSGG